MIDRPWTRQVNSQKSDTHESKLLFFARRIHYQHLFFTGTQESLIEFLASAARSRPSSSLGALSKSTGNTRRRTRSYRTRCGELVYCNSPYRSNFVQMSLTTLSEVAKLLEALLPSPLICTKFGFKILAGYVTDVIC